MQTSSCREPFLCRVLPPEQCWLFGAPGVLRMGEGVQEKRGARETVLGSFQVRKMSLPSRESSTSWVSALLQSASLIIKTGVSPCEDAAKAVEEEERGEETLHCSDGVLSNKTTALHPAFDALLTSSPEAKSALHAGLVLFTSRIAPHRRPLPAPKKLQSVEAGPLVVERSPEEGLWIERPERTERETVSSSDPALLWTRRR